MSIQSSLLMTLICSRAKLTIFFFNCDIHCCIIPTTGIHIAVGVLLAFEIENVRHIHYLTPSLLFLYLELELYVNPVVTMPLNLVFNILCLYLFRIFHVYSKCHSTGTRKFPAQSQSVRCRCFRASQDVINIWYNKTNLA